MFSNHIFIFARNYMKASSLFVLAAFLLLAIGPALSQHSHQHKGKADSQADTSRVPREIYSCPMHPEVKSDKPGKCPKCGMKLKKVIPKAPKDSLQTKHTSAPAPEAEMVMNVDVKQSGDRVRIHSGELIGGVEAMDDSVSETVPAGQVQTTGRSSCCVKPAKERKADGAPKHK